MFLCCAPGQVNLCTGLFIDIPPYQVTEWGLGLLLLPCLCFSYPSLYSPSVICCAETIHLALSSSSREIVLYMDIYSVCLWERVSSGSSYTAILDHLCCLAF